MEFLVAGFEIIEQEPGLGWYFQSSRSYQVEFVMGHRIKYQKEQQNVL